MAIKTEFAHGSSQEYLPVNRSFEEEASPPDSRLSAVIILHHHRGLKIGLCLTFLIIYCCPFSGLLDEASLLSLKYTDTSSRKIIQARSSQVSRCARWGCSILLNQIAGVEVIPCQTV